MYHHTTSNVSSTHNDNDDDDKYNNNNNGNNNTSTTIECITPSSTTTVNIDSSSNSSHTISLLTHHPTILYILITETAERFTYYGFRAILVLYIIHELQYTDTTAIALYGYNSSITYFTPLIGAYIADNYYGRYTTILHFSIIYIIGLGILSYAAAIQYNDHQNNDNNNNNNNTTSELLYKRCLSFSGLFLISIGTGGIKPCVSSFGADQLTTETTTEGVTPNRTHNTDPFQSVDITTSESLQQSQLHLEDDGVYNTNNSSCNDNSNAIRVYFNYFYFCINIGAITSIAIIPYIRHYSRGGFSTAFGTSLLCMIIAILIFYSKRNAYNINVPNNNNSNSNNNSSANILSTFRLTYHLFIQRMKRNYPNCTTSLLSLLSSSRWLRPPNRLRSHSHGSDMNYNIDSNDEDNNITTTNHNFDSENGIFDNRNSDRILYNTNQERQTEVVADADQILNILPILAMFPIYSCLYDQQGSVWTIQATHMYLPYNIQPEQMNMINPLLIMIFIPLFDQIIYPYLQYKCHISIAPLRLMSWGMFLTALAFTCSGIVDSMINYHDHNQLDKVHVMWQLPQIILLAAGEIFLSVTGLEFAYAQSPARLKAFVTALYLSTTGIGDLLAGLLYSTIFSNMKRSYVMHICAGMMLCNMRIFMWVARWYENQSTSSIQQLESYSAVETDENETSNGYTTARPKSDIELI